MLRETDSLHLDLLCLKRLLNLHIEMSVKQLEM